MTGTFKANHPYNNLLLFIYALLLRLYFFSSPAMPALLPDDGLLYKYGLTAMLELRLPAGFYSSLAFLLLFAQALVLNQISSVQRLFPKANYLPGMSYLLITALVPGMNRFSSILILISLLIGIQSMIARLHHSPSPKSLVFNIGLLCSLSSLIYFPACLFLVMPVVGILIFRPFSLKEWVTLILGAATPYYFLLAFLFLTDHLSAFSLLPIHFSSLSFSLATSDKIILAVLTGVLISGLFFNQKESGRQLAHSRKCWFLLFFQFVPSVAVLFVGQYDDTLLLLPALPAAWMASNTFYYPSKSWFPVLLHWLLVAGVVFVQMA